MQSRLDIFWEMYGFCLICSVSDWAMIRCIFQFLSSRSFGTRLCFEQHQFFQGIWHGLPNTRSIQVKFVTFSIGENVAYIQV